MAIILNIAMEASAKSARNHMAHILHFHSLIECQNWGRVQTISTAITRSKVVGRGLLLTHESARHMVHNGSRVISHLLHAFHQCTVGLLTLDVSGGKLVWLLSEILQRWGAWAAASIFQHFHAYNGPIRASRVLHLNHRVRRDCTLLSSALQYMSFVFNSALQFASI
jgi:hypothetical protein